MVDLTIAEFKGFAEQWHVMYELPDGSRVYNLTGTALTILKGTGADWVRKPLRFSVGIPRLDPGKGLNLHFWAPFISLNAIANESVATNAGWAVDSFRIIRIPPPTVEDFVRVECDLAARDVDGFVFRLGYNIHIVGNVENLHN